MSDHAIEAAAVSAPGSALPVVFVRGIGLIGPGLTDWLTAREAIARPSNWNHAPTIVPMATRLPAAERRRAGEIVKLSLAVADQACANAGVEVATLTTVFSASTGDAKNCHSLCEALALPERLVSPTRFTNSVHNASAGYWHIACGSQAPSTSLCAYDGSFCAGLLEATVQCVSAGRPVLLVAADVPYPEPLHGARPIDETMGVALVLSATASTYDIASVQVLLSENKPDVCDEPRLEALRNAAPTGRSLPLLQALAGGTHRSVVLEYLDGLSLNVAVSPVSVSASSRRTSS